MHQKLFQSKFQSNIRNLTGKADDFKMLYMEASKNYSKDKIIFIDGLKIDLCDLDSEFHSKRKRNREITIAVPLTANGTIMKPQIIINNENDINIEGNETISIVKNTSSTIEIQEFENLLKENIKEGNSNPEGPWLIVTPDFNFLKQFDVNKAVKTNNARILSVPKGLSFMLNPLKDVFPQLLDIIMKLSKSYEGNVEDMLLMWVEEAINALSRNYSYILENSFSCLIKQN